MATGMSACATVIAQRRSWSAPGMPSFAFTGRLQAPRACWSCSMAGRRSRRMDNGRHRASCWCSHQIRARSIFSQFNYFIVLSGFTAGAFCYSTNGITFLLCLGGRTRRWPSSALPSSPAAEAHRGDRARRDMIDKKRRPHSGQDARGGSARQHSPDGPENLADDLGFVGKACETTGIHRRSAASLAEIRRRVGSSALAALRNNPNTRLTIEAATPSRIGEATINRQLVGVSACPPILSLASGFVRFS